MTAGESVAVGVGVAQAIALAVAAIFAWKAYDAAKQERLAAARDRRGWRSRRLLQAVIDETKALANIVEERVPGVGNQLFDLIMGQQLRLQVALGFVPEEMLEETRALATGAAQQVNKTGLEAGAAEQAEAAYALAPSAFEPGE
jgi:hypothetical protein